MKPILLEMEGFGPYVEKTTINFEKFPNYLTLISGDTGAGKTTIFDAICCALYGNPSGNKRSFEMMRSKMIPDDKDTFVRFEFELRGKRYSVTRSPIYSKKKEKGEGFTKKSSKAKLSLPGEKDIEKVTEVNIKIKEILGIEKREFSQIVMLAQNDFMSMINDTNSDQEKTFNRIFNAGIFTKFSKKVREKTKEYEIKKNNSEEFILSNLNNSGFEFSKELKTADLRNEKIFDLIKEKEEEIFSQEKKVVKKLNNSKSKLEKAKKKETEAVSLAEIFNQREETQKELLGLENKKTKISNLKQKKERAEQARDKVLEPYTKFKETKKVINTLDSQKDKLKTNLEDLKDKINSNNKFLKKFSEEEQDKLFHDYKSLQDKLDQYKRLEKIQTSLKDFKNQIEELEKKEKEEKENLKDKKEKIESIQVIPIDEFNINEERLKISQEKTKGLLNNLSQINNNLTSTKSLINNLKKQREILYKKQKDFSLIEKEYRSSYRQFLESQAAFLAEQLKENEPCPVCGSLEHPHPAEYSNKKVSEDEVKKLKNKQEESQNQLTKEIRNYTSIKDKLSLNLTNLIELDKSKLTISENLDNSILNLKEFQQELNEDKNINYESIDSALAYLDQLIKLNTDKLNKTLNQIKDEIDKNIRLKEKNDLKSKEKVKLENEVAELTKSLEELNNKLKEKEIESQNLIGQEKGLKSQLEFSSLAEAEIKNKEKEKAYLEYKEHFDNLKEKSKDFQNKYSKTKGELENTENQLKTNKTNLVKEEKNLNKALKEAKFKDLKAFKLNSLRPEELQVISREITEYDQKLRSTNESIQKLNKVLENSATRF